MFFESNNNSLQSKLLGIYSASPRLLRDRNVLMGLYNFFDGEAKTENDLLSDITRGQSWLKPTDLDYTPSQDIRNHVKKLIMKQGRFMFGKSPYILMKPIKETDKNLAEEKRRVMDYILDEDNFWGKTFKAFLDCTIGKRVLLTVIANPGEPMSFRYYTSMDFTYKVDPNDYSKLTEVIIAYCEDLEVAFAKQVWSRWKYYMQNGKCWLQSGTYDGNAQSLGDEQITNTGLDELPCKVIINGGLTGDTNGTSDIEDLMDLQNAYNRTTSDYRDTLRFRMFEQPVFINADSDSLENIKIAPNAMIDLKTDPTIEMSSGSSGADAKMLSSTFNFVEGAEGFLERVKGDMYEIMDQPRPEYLKDVPSAKAMKFMFYDLMSRCEEKWQEWEPAIKWLLKYMDKCIKQFKLYPELRIPEVETSIIISRNYPIPEDEESQKKIAILEVEGKVRSHKSYIRDFSDIEDEDGEWNELIKESVDLTSALDSFNLGGIKDEGGADNNNQ